VKEKWKKGKMQTYNFSLFMFAPQMNKEAYLIEAWCKL